MRHRATRADDMKARFKSGIVATHNTENNLIARPLKSYHKYQAIAGKASPDGGNISNIIYQVLPFRLREPTSFLK